MSAVDPAELIKELDGALEEVGEDVLLRKLTVDAEGAEIVTLEKPCRASVRASQPQDLVEGGVRDIAIVLSATGVDGFGVPEKDDRVVLLAQGDNPTNVENADPIIVAGQLVRVNLICRG
jgi:hypothetical protein